VNFELNEDERLLKLLAERFVADRYDLERRRGYLAAEHGFSPDNWALLGELGLTAALAADMDGLDATGIATLFEVLGRGLVVEPLIENVLVAARLFAATAPQTWCEEWLADLSSGARRIAFAHAEEGGRPGRLWVETRAEERNGVTRLTGAKAYVPAGSGADGYIVSARVSGMPGDENGLALFFVPAEAAGLTRSGWLMADGSTAVSLVLDDVAIGADQQLQGGAAEIAQAQIVANLARTAEALGVMERLFAETLDYLRTREQFGAKLGSFQAIQHRMAAQYAALEQARGLLNLALVSEGASAFARAVQGARAFIGPASVTLGHEMMQFHGGMGMTDELPIGQGHKRLLVLSRWPDSPEAALDLFAGIES